jgi:hypothetical protein
MGGASAITFFIRGMGRKAVSTTGTVNTLIGPVSVAGTMTFDVLPAGNYGGTSTDIPAVTWTTPTLSNGWTNAGGVFPTTGYYKDSLGMIHLKIACTNTVASNAVIMTLPAGYRPAGQVYSLAYTSGVVFPFYITTAGAVTPDASTAQTGCVVGEFVFTPGA